MRTLAFFLVVGCLGLVGCGTSGSDSEPQRIVLIVVDTLRADALPWYGAEPEKAPFLAELTETSTVFERAHSTSSWTGPATASLLTSLWPFQHGVLNGLVAARALAETGVPVLTSRLPASAPTLAEVLASGGWRTFGVSANPNVAAEAGFDRGFERFVTLEGSAAAVGDAVEAWREEFLSSERAFLYLHYMDPHAPYHLRETELDEGTQAALDRYLADAPPNRPAYSKDPRGLRVRHVLRAQRDGRLALSVAATADLLRAAYASEVRFFDARLRELWERFELDSAVVIVTADHGEEFGEHGGFGHEFSLFEELTHVPLLVREPGARQGGRPAATVGRIAHPVSLVDVFPTVRRFAAAPELGVEAGFDLFEPLPNGAPRTLVAGRTEGTADGGSRTLNAVWSDPLKWIGQAGTGAVQLFDLESDPGEHRSLSAERAQDARALGDSLKSLFSTAPRHEREFVETELDADRRAELESLGYWGD